MTLQSSGSISISDINAEFGLGNNLGAYKGVRWFKDDNRRGYFPSGGNAYIDISAFYAKRKNSPVTPGSWTRSSAGTYSFTVPMFNILTITVTGGTGGQAGLNGIYYGGPNNGQVCSYGAGGNAGGASSFGTRASASGGIGGSTGGAIGLSGQTQTVTLNVDTDESLFALYGTSINAVVGAGGLGGLGGQHQDWVSSTATSGGYYQWSFDIYGNPIRAASGFAGSAGSVTLSWT